MNKKIYLYIVIIIALTVIILYSIHAFSNRYEIVPIPGHTYAYKIDKWTGKVWYVHPVRGIKLLDEN